MEDSNSVSAWKSASLYIGDLSDTVVEADLMEIFSVFGPLESVKVCRNWDTGQPLGYGFLNFENEDHAETALKTFNFKKVHGQPCRLMWSTKRSASSLKEDHAANVFVKGLAKSVDNQLLFDTFSQCGTVLSSRVARNKKGVSLGYGYVSFASDNAAERAIRQINGLEMHGQVISVECFIDKTQREEKPWSNVHIMGIPPTWTKEVLKARFCVYGEIRSAVIMTNEFGVSRGFGFVDFVQHHSAVLAVEDNQTINLTSLYQSSTYEEKQRYSPILAHSYNDPIFAVKLRVTPALKKVEKTMKRVPRAGHNPSRFYPVAASSQASDMNDLFYNINANDPIHRSLQGADFGLGSYPGFCNDTFSSKSLDLYPMTHPHLSKPRLNRADFSASTCSTRELQVDDVSFLPDISILTEELNAVCLNDKAMSPLPPFSPPGFPGGRF